MIKILAKDYSPAVSYICNRLNNDVIERDLLLSNKTATKALYIKNCIESGAKALILVGNVGDLCSLFAETFSLSMFYDKFAERNVLQYCKLTKSDIPPQHVMDKLCIAPETFNHFAAAFGYQCACYGEYNKCHVYIIPDDVKECACVYDNYLSKSLLKTQNGLKRYAFKVFGLSQKDVSSRLNKLNRSVSHRCETSNLDTKIVITFPPRYSKPLVQETLEKVNGLFDGYVYAEEEQTLAKTVVDLLIKLKKTVSTAESVTGGMIASSIVDIAGASSVLHEGIVTYSIQSKCKRLGLNPHFIDEHGVVSKQVAQAMAEGLRKNGSDIAVSITGFAGPTAEEGLPVGLCYIGISTDREVSVYQNVFAGDRNSIRAQATNMALFLIYKTLTK